MTIYTSKQGHAHILAGLRLLQMALRDDGLVGPLPYEKVVEAIEWVIRSEGHPLMNSNQLEMMIEAINP